MKQPRVVIDTSVWIAALRSRRGASYQLFRWVGGGRFEVAVSVPLILEYEAAAMRMIETTSLTVEDVGDILDYVCSVAIRQKISYLWRPRLVDVNDDMVLELAANASCSHIVTFNLRHFHGAESFGLAVVAPQAFLRVIGA